MLQNLAKGRPFHPDETHMRPTDPRGNNGGGGNNGILSAFMPGQQAALAQQLNQGFGGGQGQWKGILAKMYAPMQNASYLVYRGGGSFGGGGDGKSRNKNKNGDSHLVGDDPGTPGTEAYLTPWNGFGGVGRR